MELELQIVRDPYGSLAKQLVRVFGEAGGDVGRAPDNYWALPDPGHFLSGHHCDIVFRDGAFWVKDTSRNGVFVNGSRRPLGFGSTVRVWEGDTFSFATYRVRARIRTRGRHSAAPVTGGVRPGPCIPCEEAMATTDPMQELGVPSQTNDEPALQNAEPTPVVEAGIEQPSTVQVLEAAQAVQSTGEHQQLDVEHDALVVDEVSVAAAPADSAAGLEPVPEAVLVSEPVPEPEPEPPSVSKPEPEPVPEPEPEPEPIHDFDAAPDLAATRVIDPAVIAAELPRIIHIDRARLQADGHLPPESLERLISNQFRHIKRPVIKNAFGKVGQQVPNGHLVMVTSSLPDEGKTFSSINLALSLAREKDFDVVLVDADVAKQHLSRIFGVSNEPGLLNALADDSLDIESLIVPTDIKGLSLLPSGQQDPEDAATELLASARMEEIAARIGERRPRRIALFDSPPLLLTNESRVLASLMGQILLVVRAGVTPHQAVLEAIGYVDEEKPLGLVLNRARSHAPGSYYGYGSYGYGAYGQEPASNR